MRLVIIRGMRTAIRACLIALGFLAAHAASAQFVPMARCGAAFPCSIPFGLQYRPDPLIVGPYGAPGIGFFSFGVSLDPKPTIRIDVRRGNDSPVDAAVRTFLEEHPAEKKKTADKKPTPEPPSAN